MADEFVDAPGPEFVDLPGPTGVSLPFETKKIKMGDQVLDYRPADKAFFLHNGPKGAKWYYDPLGKQEAPDAPPEKGKSLLQKFGDIPLMQAALGPANSALLQNTLGSKTPNPTPASIRQGIVNIPQAVVQMGGMASDLPGYLASKVTGQQFQPSPISQGINQFISRDRAAAERKYSDPNDVVGNMVGAAMVPIPIPGAGQGAGMLGRIGAGALQGAVAAPATMPVADAENMSLPQQIWEKTKQAGGGMLFGGAVPVLGKLAQKTVIPVGAKIMNAIQGVLNPEAEKIMANARSLGVDIKPTTIQAAMKKLPGEVDQAKTAVEAFSAQLDRDMKSTPFSGLDDIKQAAAKPGPRQATAQTLLQQAEVGSTEAKDLLKTSAGISALREKMRMDRLAALRDSLAGDLADVPTPKTISAIDGAIEQLKLDQRSTHDTEIKSLEAFRNRLAGDGEKGNGQTFQTLSVTRSSLGSEISKSYKGVNAVAGDLDAKILQPIRDALSEDISNAAQESGNPALVAADKIFRTEYSRYMGTFKDPAIISAIKSPDPDKVMEAFSRAGKDKAQRIYDALDAKGQAAAAKGIFDEAMTNAVNKRTGDFIPGNVSAGITDKMDALGVVMKGENRFKLDGIKNVMQYLAKAEPEQASALGQRITESGVKAMDKSGAIVGLAKWLKEGGTNVLFGSAAGKRFLFAASTVKPGTPAMDKLMAQLPGIMARSPKPTEQKVEEVTE